MRRRRTPDVGGHHRRTPRPGGLRDLGTGLGARLRRLLHLRGRRRKRRNGAVSGTESFGEWGGVEETGLQDE